MLQSRQGKGGGTPVLELHEDPVDAEFLQILGKDPNEQEQNMFEMHNALHARWGHILLHGMDKEEKLKVSERYPLPTNCRELVAPILNPEIVGILSNVHIKRDNTYYDMQKKLSKGMSALIKGLNTIITDKENISRTTKEGLLSSFGDAGRILSDQFHDITTIRRTLIFPSLNKTMKELVEKTTPKEYLFGTELGEKIKDAKALDKARKDLKPEPSSSQSSFIPSRVQRKQYSYRPPAPVTKPNKPSSNRRRPTRQGETKSHKGRYPRKDAYYPRRH